MPKSDTYTPAVIDEIIRRISDGETLRGICRSDEKKFPAPTTFRAWVVENLNGLHERYARARESQAEAWSDDIMAVASASEKDTKFIRRRDGSEDEACDFEWIARSRLRVDTMKWLMAKLHPRAYGEKIEQTITGKEGGAPIVVCWGEAPKLPQP